MPKVIFNGDEEEVEKGAEVKDISKKAGWPVAYGCEDGMCGTCILEVKEGKENLTEMSDKEEQTLEIMCMNDGNYRLGCQCKVEGDVEFDQP